MDALFSVLDGAAALWLCLFSPRRYLLLVVRTKLAARGARNYIEAYLRVNLVPALLAASLFQFNSTMERGNVDLLLQKENERYGLPAGHLQTIYHQSFSQDQLINIINFVQSKNMMSLSFFIGAMATYYSLSRSREFGSNWRKMRHALQLITMNALTILTLQVAQSAVQSVFLLSVDADNMALPPATTEDLVVRYAMIGASGWADRSGARIFLTVFLPLLQILSAVVSVRLLILLARSLHIGFWRSIWLQLRYAVPVALILILLLVCARIRHETGQPACPGHGAVTAGLRHHFADPRRPGMGLLSRRPDAGAQGRLAAAIRSHQDHPGRARRHGRPGADKDRPRP